MTFFYIIYLISVIVAIALAAGVIWYSMVSSDPGFRVTRSMLFWVLMGIFCPLFNTLLVSVAIIFAIKTGTRGIM